MRVCYSLRSFYGKIASLFAINDPSRTTRTPRPVAPCQRSNTLAPDYCANKNNNRYTSLLSRTKWSTSSNGEGGSRNTIPGSRRRTFSIRGSSRASSEGRTCAGRDASASGNTRPSREHAAAPRNATLHPASAKQKYSRESQARSASPSP